MSTCGSTRKVEFDLFERDLAFTTRNRVQPIATSCDLPRKGLRSITTFVSEAPQAALNGFGTQRSLVQIQSPRPVLTSPIPRLGHFRLRAERG